VRNLRLACHATVMAKDPESENNDRKVNPIHILLFCLAVAAIIFAGSIALSVFYVGQNGVSQPQP
jgi:hypothetical protein